MEASRGAMWVGLQVVSLCEGHFFLLLKKNASSEVTLEDHRYPLFHRAVIAVHTAIFGTHLQCYEVKVERNLGSLQHKGLFHSTLPVPVVLALYFSWFKDLHLSVTAWARVLLPFPLRNGATVLLISGCFSHRQRETCRNAPCHEAEGTVSSSGRPTQKLSEGQSCRLPER